MARELIAQIGIRLEMSEDDLECGDPMAADIGIFIDELEDLQ